MNPLLISLSSYGAAEVRRHGQAGFARLARDAGADGVEVRSELLPDAAEAELAALAEVGNARVYSCHEGLWRDDGGLALEALDLALARTRGLGAQRLKMSIGGFGAGSASTLVAVRERLAGSDVELLIENDQTPSAGTLPALKRFFEVAEVEGLVPGMTFDLGNWHWLGECPLQAAQALGARVRYVHCKGVQRLPAKWVAVPLAESQAPWRAALRTLPAGVPWAIEYPLAGDDLATVTRDQLAVLRAAADLP